MMTPFALLKARMARGTNWLMTLLPRPNLRIVYLCEQRRQGCMKGDLWSGSAAAETPRTSNPIR